MRSGWRATGPAAGRRSWMTPGLVSTSSRSEISRRRGSSIHEVSAASTVNGRPSARRRRASGEPSTNHSASPSPARRSSSSSPGAQTMGPSRRSTPVWWIHRAGSSTARPSTLRARSSKFLRTGPRRTRSTFSSSPTAIPPRTGKNSRPMSGAWSRPCSRWSPSPPTAETST